MKTIAMKATLKAAFTGAALGMIPVVQVTHAQQQVVDPTAAAGKQSTMAQSLNGTPVQNIAAPNASGLSHNQFSSFNVGTPGLVINNSAVNAVSQIGGAVVANPNLAGGQARLILNEVTSGNRSLLQGAQELLGGRAAYILANPNGITCDGCGFINFPRATLTTGAPQFNNGALTGFGVSGGDVLVGPGGLNATGADFFDIITRSAVLNGQVNARDLSFRLGSNDVDYATLATTARAAGDVPVFSLDSSALGGMYAGRISLIGTEAGVGVRLLGNVAASVSDIDLDVNGQITLKDNVVGAQRNLNIRSTQVASVAGNEIELLNAQVSAGGQVNVQGGDVRLDGGKTVAGTDLAISGRTLESIGGQREAGQNLNLTGSGAITVTGGTVQANRGLAVNGSSLTLNNATLMGEADGVDPTAGSTSVTVGGALDINNSSLFSGNTLNVSAASVDVDAASHANGTKGLRGKGAVGITTAALTNAGLVASDAGLTINGSGTTVTNTGKLFGATGLNITATNLTNRSVVESGAAMTLNVASISNDAANALAEIYAIGNLNITGNNTLSNQSSAAHVAKIVSRDGKLDIDSRSGAVGTQSVQNNGGLLFGGNGVDVEVSREFVNRKSAGRKGYVFANNGDVLIGGINQAAVTAAPQDITVSNIDSDIEARVGNITINASRLYNTTDAAAPTVADGNWTRHYGWFDHDDNPATPSIEAFSNCGTYDDHFDKDVTGKICAVWYDTRSQYLVNPDTSPRSRIIAGNNFNAWIESEALNYISLISAGNNIDIQGTGSFENRAIELRHDRNTLMYRYENGGTSSNPAGECYTDGVFNRCFMEDGLHKKKRFADISPGTLSTYTVGMASTVQARGTININLARVGNHNSGDNGERTGGGFVAPAGTGQTSGNPGGAPGSGIGSLTGSPFFVPSSDPASPFLFETDPRLMSLEGLYGSDLFLKSLGLDPTDYLRVGDPYFEQQLLRQQLLAEAGQLFIADGMAGENEQFKLLMENAVAAKDDLQLRVGVALTKEQIANLQKDIVWMVETEVNGKKALVPQLYLSDATKAKLAEGARFVASNINVKTEGAISNSGAFVASNNIDLKAGTTFTNSQGTLVAANGLSIEATGDILNQSGTISGGNVTLTSTEGSIVNETLKRDVAFGDAGEVTYLGNTASIQSTGKLTLDAKQDIVSRGGDITAGGDATLKAGNDITLTAIERKTFTSEYSSSGADGHSTTTITNTNSTRQVGSGLTVGGNLDATAARDINVEASSVDVAGNGRLDAGRDINVTALAEQTDTTTTTATRSWNSNYEQDTEVKRTTGAASSLNFGGNLAISSGNDTNIKGSQIAVGGDLNVEKIGGDLNVTTFEEKTTVSQTTKTSSFFGGEAKAEAGKNITESKATASATLYSSSKETVDIDSTTHLRSGIAVGGNLNAGGDAIKGDVNITGSNIATGGDLNLAAGGNINILAAEDKTTVNQTSESFSLNVSTSASIDGAEAGIGAQYDESSGSATQTTAQVSGLSAGGNIDINAGGDFTEQGTQVAAGGDIKVEADSITSLAAQNTYTETGESLSVSVGIGVKAETGLGGVVGAFVDDKTNKAGFDMAAASEGLNGLDVPDAGSVKAELSVSVSKTKTSASGNDAVASGFTSGGNTSFKAREGDATFHGTNVEAGGSIDVSADKGSVKILTADSASQSSKSTTDASVTIGVSADGTFSGSGSGSEKTESSSSTTQQAASFKAGKDMNITAKDDVTLVGTNLEAGGTASIEAKEGKIDFLAARDTSSASSDEMNANASFSANVTGKEGSVGGGGGELSTRESSSTGKAGSLSAGNIVLKSKGDITLEGTNVAAADSATIQTEGKLDFKAVESTYSRTAQGQSGQVDLEAGATGGGAKVAGSRTDENEQGTTRTGGSLSAKNLTINAGNGARLEGTQVDVTENASIDTGKGSLVIESAVSTYTKTVDNTAVEVGAKGNAKQGSGQGSFKMEGAYEDTNQVKNQNATLNIGGKADIKAAGGIQIAGANIENVGSVIKAGETNLNGASVGIEQRQDVDQSTKSNVGVSVGVIVPGKKTRKEVSDTVQKVRDSDAANTLKNKVGNATTAISNAADSAKTKLANVGSDAATKAKADSDLAQRVQDRKDTNTATKLTNNTAQADRNATRKNADKRRDAIKAEHDQRVAKAQTQLDAAKAGSAKAADKSKADAQKVADKAKADAQKVADKSKADAQKVADKAKADALKTAEQGKADAKKTADQDVAKAEAKRDTDEAKAKKDREEDQGVVDAKNDQKKALEDRKAIDIAKAAEDAAHKKAIAQLDADERTAKEKADRDAAREQQAIQRDDSLSGTQKADKLKQVADQQAEAREQAAKDHAAAVEAKQKARDDIEKQAAIDAIDPSATDAEKTAQRKAIDDRFKQRETARDDAKKAMEAKAGEDRQAAQAVAKADHDQRKARADADAKLQQDKDNVAAQRQTADDQADRDYLKKTRDIQDKLAQDSVGKTDAEKATLQEQADKDKAQAKADMETAKRDSQLKADTDLATFQREADAKRVKADAERAKAEAERTHDQELADLNKLNPRPADYTERVQAIDQRLTDAKDKADKRVLAQEKDFAATEAERKAQAERTKRDADIDADATLTAKQKEQKKAESEKTFLAEQKTAQAEHDTAKKDMAALLSPAEKAAADAAAAKAEKQGDRVKNPYALSARLKPHLTKARRWKEVVTSFGMDVDRRAAPVEEEEAEAATTVDLLALARQFQAGEQPLAMQLLREPAVQDAAAVTAAVDSLREEARDGLLKALRLEMTGKELGVLTVAQQREALGDLGIELPANLPSTEVTKRFNAYLDDSVAALQPDAAQKAEILKALGKDVKPEKVEEAYTKLLSDGAEKARERAAKMGLSTAQADALAQQFQP
ncbi:hemagglutinin repeat-containing protein [Hydrogenophaga intermedia]|uniref:Putative hemolysin n=1 Tax=Hydrogenophaga intermedia TaxID=65786 RepID=A0A1L1PT10_HYDIT|nr:hemagglutinin repeat-containing protein [Hydrogenophaga intermedia]TMU73847.1 filamentous hemagglutinin N-terminal domain-containing protein [Hydrogenophaga intermedia]CDN87731.1 Putative hemolysin [Hydrogenophaga intermedia]